MYVQSTSIRVPMDHMTEMRGIIAREYLPKIRVHAGFVSAMLLEQIDDPDRAELLIVWDSQEAVERFSSTGLLEATVHSLAASLPGAQIQRQGYAVTIFKEAQVDLEDTRPAALQS